MKLNISLLGESSINSLVRVMLFGFVGLLIKKKKKIALQNNYYYYYFFFNNSIVGGSEI